MMNITIAGAGGIGSNVAVHLIRSGITRLTIIDFDKVEASNLNRQFYFADQIGQPKVKMLAHNLGRINPDIDITCVNTRITEQNIDELFADCNIIVEGFDSISEKKMVLEKFGNNTNLMVSASGIAGCEVETITTRKIGNCYIVGDFAKDCRFHPLFSHKVSAVAAKMAEIILLHGEFYANI